MRYPERARLLARVLVYRAGVVGISQPYRQLAFDALRKTLATSTI
jgi:hypothetical protein